MSTTFYKRLLLILAPLFLLVAITSFKTKRNYQGKIIVKSIDPLIKVTYDLSEATKETLSYSVAKNEEVHLQFVIWNKQPLKDISIQCDGSIVDKATISLQRVGYVSIKEQAVNIKNKITASDGKYPDPLSGVRGPVDLNAGTTTFWVSFTVVKHAAPGTYTVPVKFSGLNQNNKTVTLQKNIQVTVKDAVISTKDYPWYSNWLFIDIPSLGPNVKKMKYLNEGKDVIPYNDDYWKKVNAIASFMHNAGQNVVLISPQRLANFSYKDDKLIIDFSRFDSMVDQFQRNGVIGRIEGQQICSRSGGWESDFIVHYIKKDAKGNAAFANGKPADKEVQDFYKVYMPALITHLKTKNLFNNYYQHIADEPVDANAASYLDVLKMLKAITPEIKTIEAIQTKKVAEQIDIPVPQLDYFASNSDYFQKLIASGKEVWIYTAFLPQGSFVNRFIEQEALKHRLLFWLMAKYNIRGALNWGFNYWEGNDAYSQLGKRSGNYVLPAGDGFLAYPAKDGLLSSIRIETFKDGLNDYALLQNLKRSNPRKAKELTDKVILGYSQYITDVAAFRNIRNELLNAQ